MEAAEVLLEVAGQVAACTRCQLQFSRKRAVPGEGPADSAIMLIGEGPGFYENEQGRPFVGAAGKYLDELLSKAGLSRAEVFITNVVKCRPPGNRDPLPEELFACSGYLDRQIDTINPLVVVTLGRYSMTKFLPNVKISEAHGKPAWVRGRLIVPMFHPAAALHQPSLKTSVERDFARLPEWIQEARQSGRTNGPAVRLLRDAPGLAPQPAAQQGDLFAQANLFIDPNEAAALEPEETEKPDQPTQLTLF